MGKSRRWFANKDMTLIGTFIVSPSAKLYPSGYEWRHMETAKGRRFAKRELRKFRRADGKRRINEAMATILETEATLRADMQALLDQELYDSYLYDDPDDYDCPCCRPEWLHEDYDYWADYDAEIRYGHDYYRDYQDQSYDERIYDDGWWAGYQMGRATRTS